MGRLCEDCMSELAATHKGLASPLHCTSTQRANLFTAMSLESLQLCQKASTYFFFFFFSRRPARRSETRTFARGSSESKLAVGVSASLRRQLDENSVGVTLLKVKHTHALVLFFFSPFTFLCLSLSRTRRL